MDFSKGDKDIDGNSSQNIDKRHTVSTITHDGVKLASQPRYFLVRHSQSPDIPDCPQDTSVLWSGYSLYSYMFGQQTITQDLGTLDSCVRLTDHAYYSYCSVPTNCGRISIASWLSDHNTSISRCTVCHVLTLPLTLHSQSTTPPPCPFNWSPLWQGFSHIQVTICYYVPLYRFHSSRMFWVNQAKDWHQLDHV